MSELKFRLVPPPKVGAPADVASAGTSVDKLKLSLEANRMAFDVGGSPFRFSLDLLREPLSETLSEPPSGYDKKGEEVLKDARHGDRLLEVAYDDGRKTFVNLSVNPEAPRDRFYGARTRILNVIEQAGPIKYHGEARRLELVDEIKSRLASMHQQQMDIIRRIR